MSTEDKLRAIREWMAQEGLDALVVPTDDPHGSEYLAEHWQCRKWLTGFTGSAGTAVVTAMRPCCGLIQDIGFRRRSSWLEQSSA